MISFAHGPDTGSPSRKLHLSRLHSTETVVMARPYESEITRFLRELKQANPTIEPGQREGRAIWWDKNIDLDLDRRFQQSRVPQPAYVYQTKAR